MAITLITGPLVEPVTLAEAKAHLNLSDTGSPASHPDDTLVTGLIQASREHAERFTRRAFVQQTWDLFLDEFPSVIKIPKPPMQSVTSVKYIDDDGVEQTLASSVYTVDTNSDPGRIYRAYNQVWPTIRNQRHAVTIRFVAGYTDSGASPQVLADNVPQTIKIAMLLHVGHMYEHRESVSDFAVHSVPMGWESLLYPYRILDQ